MNPKALERLIYNESRGNPAVGIDKSNYSAGIGQVSRAVWRKYTDLPYIDSADPKYYETNMRVAAKYLKENYNYFGNYKEALMAYNMGKSALIQAKHGLRNIPKVTQAYVSNFKE